MSRMKKITALGAGFLLAVSGFFTVPVFGEEIDPSLKIYDYADIFSDEEEAVLQEEFEIFADTYYADVVFVTTNDLEGKSEMEYADDFFDYNGFGLGDTRDGSLYLLNMEDRNFWLSTRGGVMDYVTDSVIESTNDRIRDQLREEDYMSAARSYLEGVTPRDADGEILGQVEYRQRVFDFTDRFMNDQGTLEDFAYNMRVSAGAYDLDMLFCTLEDFEGEDPWEYAAAILEEFEAESAALGETAQSGGLLLLLDEDDFVYLAASGDIAQTLGTEMLEDKEEELDTLFHNGDSVGAFAAFIEISDLYADAKGWARGTMSPPPSSWDIFVERAKSSLEMIFLYLLIAGSAAGFAVLVMRAMNKTALKQSGARGYMKEDSFDLVVQKDVFIRTQIDRKEKPKDNDSGGSSSHSSSSGASHGGGGGSW